jgi:hypothetical protein
MKKQDCLAYYPFVVVRIRCRLCPRKGAYRLARIAAKYGPEITLRDLMELPDVEHRRPPDMPPGMMKLRLVVSKP